MKENAEGVIESVFSIRPRQIRPMGILHCNKTFIPSLASCLQQHATRAYTLQTHLVPSHVMIRILSLDLQLPIYTRCQRLAIG